MIWSRIVFSVTQIPAPAQTDCVVACEKAKPGEFRLVPGALGPRRPIGVGHQCTVRVI